MMSLQYWGPRMAITGATKSAYAIKSLLTMVLTISNNKRNDILFIDNYKVDQYDNESRFIHLQSRL